MDSGRLKKFLSWLSKHSLMSFEQGGKEREDVMTSFL